MPTSRPATGHRTRVARERRARTRARILAAAVQVFAEQGVDTPVIDDFIRAAGIARGTFYTYFRTTRELLAETSRDLEDRLLAAIEVAMADRHGPLERLATGTRLWLRHAREDRRFCGFVVRTELRGRLVEETLTRDLRAGHRQGGFRTPGIAVARDLVVGTIREAMARMMAGPVPRTYPDRVVRVLLAGLGVEPRTARRLLALPVPPLPAATAPSSPG